MNMGNTASSASPTGKKWEGKVVDQKFPLHRYLGGSDHSFVFATDHNSAEKGRAAIKLVADHAACRDAQLGLWAQAAALSHSNLLQVYESGRCQIGEESLLYVVMEYAEENLAEITSERKLTPSEAQEMVVPVLSALQGLHRAGLVHANLKPSNILAVGDKVKLSSDTLRPLGEVGPYSGSADAHSAPELAAGPVTPATDVWALGKLLREILPEHPSEAGPESDALFEVIGRAAKLDPKQRWSMAEVVERLDPSSAGSIRRRAEARSERVARAKRPFPAGVVLAIAVVILGGVLIMKPRSRAPATEGQPAVRQAPAARPKESQPATNASPAQPKPVALAQTVTTDAAQPEVRERVMPDVAPSARRTIEGHIRVSVRVDVDGLGNVTSASLTSRGPSEYFARHAVEAAKRWKFAPGAGGHWILRFVYSRGDTEVAAERTKS